MNNVEIENAKAPKTPRKVPETEEDWHEVTNFNNWLDEQISVSNKEIQKFEKEIEKRRKQVKFLQSQRRFAKIVVEVNGAVSRPLLTTTGQLEDGFMNGNQAG